MKTLIKVFISALSLVCFCQQAYSQSTITGLGPAGHLGAVPGVDYLGWMAGTPINLEIRHNAGLNIDFYNGPAPANQTMTILGANGNVGIGTAAPATVLHLNRAAAVEVITRYTNPNTVNGLSDGFDVGVTGGAGGGQGILRHLGNQPIEIWTFGQTNIRRNASFTNELFFEHTNFTEGDGLRIHDPSGNYGDLDLWTSVNASITNIKWGPNGTIRGINNRFEIQADFTNGLWFNVQSPAVRTFFNSQGAENARIGSNVRCQTKVDLRTNI